MKRLNARTIGIDQGSKVLFSDFQHDGVMWSGQGPRESRHAIRYTEAFRSTPSVRVSISMWDLDQKTNLRADISAENVTEVGFDIVFRTWADTRVARIRADWVAIGELPDPDDWQLY